jgi:hypothetical protein
MACSWGSPDPDASVRVECGKVLATIKAANSDVVVLPRRCSKRSSESSTRR